MEMQSGTSQLIDEWEAGVMEEQGCCCSSEGGAHGGFRLQDGPDPQRHTRNQPRRMAQFVVAALLLLIVGVLAIVVMIGLERPCRAPPDSQTNEPPGSLSDAYHKRLKQPETPEDQLLKRIQNPRALLTAADNIRNSSRYLLWDSQHGNAYCRGGFIYDNGDLVVPREGDYRVFLQITYNKPEDCSIHLLSNTVSYFHDNYQVDRTLLSAVDTIQCDEIISKSMYTAGLFHLQANGRLHVTSSSPKDIVVSEFHVFFGAEFLPD